MNPVGLYISANTPSDHKLLNRLVSIGMNQVFSEQNVNLDRCTVQRVTKYHPPQIVEEREDVAIISEVSPNGACLAGKQGLPIVSSAATTPGGYQALAANWELYERYAVKHNKLADRRNWSLVAPMHIAETRETARTEVAAKLPQWLEKHNNLQGLLRGFSNPVDALIKHQFAVIGNLEDALEQVTRLSKITGGFGNLLLLVHDWADHDSIYRSMELCLSALTNAPSWRH